MATRIKPTITLGMLAALLMAACGCRCPKQISTDGLLAIFVEPKSQTAAIGSSVSFSVVAQHVGPPSTNSITYQWRKDGVDIAGATNSTLTLNTVQIADVGDYSVLVTGSSLLSESASLAVYSALANGGTLTVGISSFKSGNNGQACFPTAQGWDRYYVLVGYLLGPSVTSPPSPNPFPNPGGLNSVTIDTLNSLNGSTLDTGIVINYEFNPNDKVCNDDALPVNAANPRLSKATFTPTIGSRRYRATVFYKSSSTPPANIMVRWNYP